MVREHYTIPTPDPSLRNCMERPTKPTLKDDSDEAMLIIDLDERGEDCASKLSQTWKSIDDAVSRAAQLSKPK